MWPNPHEIVDLITFTEEVLNGKLHFLFRRHTQASSPDFASNIKHF